MSVCKTVDAGASWAERRSLGPEGDYNTSCSDIAVAPSDSSIVYAGGQLDRYAKVFRSADAGNTWSDITDNLAALLTRYDIVYAVWVSPSDPGMVLAGTSRGVFRWETYGRGQSRTWSRTPLLHPTRAFAYDPGSGTIYAATENQGVYCTADIGLSWQEMNNGLGCLKTLCIELDRENGWLFVGTDGGSVWRLGLNAAEPVN